MNESKNTTQIIFKGRYSYGTGRRKSSVAQVRLYSENENHSIVIVNGQDYKEYFPTLELAKTVEDCFRVTGTKDRFAVSALINGGGKKGQSEALRHGIARALVILDEAYRVSLRDNGYLTRDPRRKERKKPGLKKARRAPQFSKR